MAKEVWREAPDSVFYGSLENATDWVDENVGHGVICPCCKGKMKRYQRTLISGYAAWLCNLVRLYRQKPQAYHVKEIGQVSVVTHDFAKLRFWEFIVSDINTDTKKRRSGMWTPTLFGEQWVDGEIRAPKHAIIQNNELLRFEGEEITVHQSLSEDFDYEQLMKPVM